MTQYLLSVWHDEDYALPDEDATDHTEVFAAVDSFNTALMESGVFVFAGGLDPASSATVVRATADGVSLTDGPYGEGKEQIGGFWVIEVADLDAALEWAKRGTAACRMPVEVRPFQG